MIAPLWTVQLINIKCEWGKPGLEFFFSLYFIYIVTRGKKLMAKKKVPGPWKIDDYN